MTLIQDKKARYAHKCLELFATLGPIDSEETVEKYLQQLKTWYQAEKNPRSPTHFKAEAASSFDEHKAEKVLTSIITDKKLNQKL